MGEIPHNLSQGMRRAINARYTSWVASGLIVSASSRPNHALAGAPPSNDTCAGAEVIPSMVPFPYLSPLIADVSSATTSGDPQRPVACVGQVPLSCSVWYQFTPAGTGTTLYSFSTA